MDIAVVRKISAAVIVGASVAATAFVGWFSYKKTEENEVKHKTAAEIANTMETVATAEVPLVRIATVKNEKGDMVPVKVTIEPIPLTQPEQ